MLRAALVVLPLLLATPASAADSPWPAALPALRLLDPLGHEFTDAQLAVRGAVVIATAPTQAQGDAQQAWSDALDTVAPDAGRPLLVLLEDMSQSWFRPIVLSRMRSAYRPGAGLLLLLDEHGAVRKALGVKENATVAFAFAPGGRLSAVETAPATAERARRLVAATR